MKSESIFWLSRKNNINISHQRSHLTSGRLCANRFFLLYEWTCPFAQQIQSIVNVRSLQQR